MMKIRGSKLSNESFDSSIFLLKNIIPKQGNPEYPSRIKEEVSSFITLFSPFSINFPKMK